MKFKLLLVPVLVAMLGLSACGGGGGSSSSSGSSSGGTSTAASPATLTFTDATVGTGTVFTNGMVASITYTAWLYTETGTDHKGTQVDTGKLDFVAGAGKVITGLEQGMAGMKVGGKRTMLIPSGLAYGASGYGSVPPNMGLVFEVTLNNEQVLTAAASPANLVKTDVVVGTGAVAATGKTATVTYTGWLYDAATADHKGTQFDTGSFSFVVGGGTVITGFDQGVTGMAVGGKRTLYIPASMAYGATAQGIIPANAGLVFDVSVTAVQ